ncbi:UDP-glycosyltransferase 87A1-like [Senna tora]|uniref:UDP-glycosyltransferase 87A1-like n=1 Tax=Senna tora TaxID=362788 RepID=A0A834T6F9_9FABA|nr:UDP-glycosyltransferase 87A1-like [Senna tora]
MIHFSFHISTLIYFHIRCSLHICSIKISITISSLRNSAKEGVFAGVPFLTLPIIMDQGLDSKIIVEDRKVGWRVKEDVRIDSLVRKDEIVKLLNKFMDFENDQVMRDMRRRVKELQHSCQRDIAPGRSFHDINAFITEITKIGIK